MKIKLITYATGDFKKHQYNLHEFAKKYSLFDDYQMFDDTWLKETLFYQKNKWIFDNVQKGAGNCLWKPYLILSELEKAEDDEAIVYMDSQDLVKISYVELFKKIILAELSIKKYCLVQGTQPTITWTKYDCFYFMNCLNEKYFSARQLEAGLIGFVKNDKTINFVKEWLGYCLNHFILLDCKSVMGSDHVTFKDHRNEQAVLTLLVLKHNMVPSDVIYNIIDYNVGETPLTHYNVTVKRIETYFE